ncbi:SpoIID/LytB domain-containing protein [Bacteroidota bacterium]
MREPSVNVAILSSKKINFELYGNYSIGTSDQHFVGVCGAVLKGKSIQLSCCEKKINFESGLVIKASDLNSDSFLIHDVIIGKEFHWQKKEKQRFTGSLKFIIERDELVAVNILPVEEYLTSVISSEMSAQSPFSFLKAHAIISRSWLITQIDNRRSRSSSHNKPSFVENENERIKWYDREEHLNYDVCADDHCQRYQGITKVFTDSARNAVKHTRGLVLKHKGVICDARYSKCCGGITETFDNVWDEEKHPYLVSRIDYRFEPDDYDINLTEEVNAEKWIRNKPVSFCSTTDKKFLSDVLMDYDQKTKNFYRWKVSYTQDELQKIIKDKSGIDFGDILDLIPVQRGHSGRLIKLKIAGSKKSLIIGKELEIRKTLSTSHLYSSAFIVEKKRKVNNIPQKFTLIGAGWGHGVGLCQIGAAVMSKLGYSFDEILGHYFKDSIIQKVY